MKFDKNLRDAISELDDLSAEIKDICNLLVIHDENMNGDFDPIREGKSWGFEVFANRWPLHQSTLSVIRIRLYDILEAMENIISEYYNSIRANHTDQAE